MNVVFVEHWADGAALAAHVAVPASGHFVTRLGELTDGRPSIGIYTAAPASL